MSIKFELTKIIHRKIRENNLVEFRSKTTRQKLAQICKEAVKELKVEVSEAEKWLEFQKQVG